MEDYKALAEELKAQGNEAFQLGDPANINKAIKLYSEALNIDPDNHVIYSNRSAAYMKADSKGQALRDAEKCIELKPDFVKGYNRLGVAQQSLKRFVEAIDTFKKGLSKAPNDKSLWSALTACQEAYEADKKQRFAQADMERKLEEERAAQREANVKKAEVSLDDSLNGFFSEINSINGTASSKAKEVANEDEAFAEFLSGINNAAAPLSVPQVNVRDESPPSEKVKKYDLGSVEYQVKRILCSNYEFKNLNPYYVLELEEDATEEDIKYRYRSH